MLFRYTRPTDPLSPITSTRDIDIRYHEALNTMHAAEGRIVVEASIVHIEEQPTQQHASLAEEISRTIDKVPNVKILSLGSRGSEGKNSSSHSISYSNIGVTGSIPASIGNLTSITALTLDRNKLTGKPPHCLEDEIQFDSTRRDSRMHRVLGEPSDA